MKKSELIKIIKEELETIMSEQDSAPKYDTKMEGGFVVTTITVNGKSYVGKQKFRGNLATAKASALMKANKKALNAGALAQMPK